MTKPGHPRKHIDDAARKRHVRAMAKEQREADLIREEDHPELGRVRVQNLPENKRRRGQSRGPERAKARRLVKEGTLIADVAKTMGRSENTIRYWLRNVEDTDEPKDYLTPGPGIEGYRYRVDLARRLVKSRSVEEVAIHLELAVEEVKFYLTDEAFDELPPYASLVRERRVHMIYRAAPGLDEWNLALDDLLNGDGDSADSDDDADLDDDPDPDSDGYEPLPVEEYEVFERDRYGELQRRALDANVPADLREYQIREGQRAQAWKKYEQELETLPKRLQGAQRRAHWLRSEMNKLLSRADAHLDLVRAAHTLGASEQFIAAQEERARALWLDLVDWCDGDRRLGWPRLKRPRDWWFTSPADPGRAPVPPWREVDDDDDDEVPVVRETLRGDERAAFDLASGGLTEGSWHVEHRPPE